MTRPITIQQHILCSVCPRSAGDAVSKNIEKSTRKYSEVFRTSVWADMAARFRSVSTWGGPRFLREQNLQPNEIIYCIYNIYHCNTTFTGTALFKPCRVASHPLEFFIWGRPGFFYTMRDHPAREFYKAKSFTEYDRGPGVAHPLHSTDPEWSKRPVRALQDTGAGWNVSSEHSYWPGHASLYYQKPAAPLFMHFRTIISLNAPNIPIQGSIPVASIRVVKRQ